MREPKPPARSQASKLLRAAGLIAFVTILSKILGFARDWGIMTVFGLSLASDAYFAAFQIPSFAVVLLGGLGGPFNTATVAVFSRLIDADRPPSDHARRLAGSFLTLTGIVFAAMSVLTYLYAGPIIGFIMPAGDPALIAMAGEQLRIMSPLVLIGGVIGIFYGLLNVYNSFFWPSISPAAMSVAILAALFVMGDAANATLLAWATLGGGILQLFLQLPDLFRHKFAVKPGWDIRSPDMIKIGELLFPAFIGTTIGQLNVFVDMFFAATLAEGGWGAVVMSNRLIQLPIGVLQTALLVPIFPMFSRFVADKDWNALRRYFRGGVVSLWFVSIPVLVILLFYTEAMVRIVFQHGSFDAHDTRLITWAILFQAPQMIPYFARDSLTRVFYAFHDARTPLLIGLVSIGFKALFDWLLVGPFGVGGITFSTTLVTFINMSLLMILSRKHIDNLGFNRMVMPFFKLAAAGFAMAGIVMLADTAMGAVPLDFSGLGFPGYERLEELTWIAVVSVLGVFTYTVTALAFRVEEANYLFDRVSARLGFLRKKRIDRR